MRIDVITIFPGLVEPFRNTALLGAAVQSGIVEFAVHDLRAFTKDRHRTVDDTPYGGGPGMVMRPEPLVEAIEALAGPKGESRSARVLLLSPQGRRFEQQRAQELAHTQHLVLVCANCCAHRCSKRRPCGERSNTRALLDSPFGPASASIASTRGSGRITIPGPPP